MEQQEIDRTFESIWEEKSQHLKTYSENNLFLLAGQPGSGKTSLRNHTLTEFPHDLMVINSDDLRERHPDFAYWQKTDPEGAPLRAQKIASEWMRRLIHRAIKHKYNLLLDGTLSGDVSTILTTLQLCKENHYYNEIRLLTVYEQTSRLGIYLRHEDQIKDKGYGRFVNKYTHDSAYITIPQNIVHIYHSGFLDSLKMYDKTLGPYNVKMMLEYDSYIKQDIPDVIEALRQYNRIQSIEECDFTIRKLLNDMEKRNAPKDYIEKFKTDLNLL